MLYGHSGSMPGFLATLCVSPADGVGAITLANATSGPDIAGIAIDLVRIVADNEPRLPDRWQPLAEVDQALLRQAEERALAERLAEVGEAAGTFLESEQFEAAMSELARLRRPVDDFFDKVTVNCDDAALRENRLRLLSRIRATLNQVADFSQIEG